MNALFAQAVWELRRNGFQSEADRAEVHWMAEKSFVPTHKVPLLVKRLIDLCNQTVDPKPEPVDPRFDPDFYHQVFSWKQAA